MSWKIIDAPIGTLACDCYEPVSASQAKNLYKDDFRAIGRYCQDVTQAELQWLTGEGLGVFFILEGLAEATRPTASLGASIASQGVARIRSFGTPTGVTVCGDLEGEGKLPADWIDFGNAEAAAIKSLGDLPCGYYGEGLGLTSSEVSNMAWPRYWKSGSRVSDRFGYIAEPSRGWCMIQGVPFDIARPDGLKIDVDIIWQDFRTNTITLMVEG